MDFTLYFLLYYLFAGVGVLAVSIAIRLLADARKLLRLGHAPVAVVMVLFGALLLACAFAAIGAAALDYAKRLDDAEKRLAFVVMAVLAFIIIEPLLVNFVGAPPILRHQPRTVERSAAGRYSWYLMFYGAAALQASIAGVGFWLMPGDLSIMAAAPLGTAAWLVIKGLRVQKQMRDARSAESVQVEDTRAPVLFLREFAREGRSSAASVPSWRLEAPRTICSRLVPPELTPMTGNGNAALSAWSIARAPSCCTRAARASSCGRSPSCEVVGIRASYSSLWGRGHSLVHGSPNCIGG